MPLLICHSNSQLKHKLNIIIGIIIFYSTYFLVSQEIRVLLFVGLCLLALIIFFLRNSDPVLGKILIAALLIRFLLAMIQAYTAIDIPGAGSDSLSYEKYGWEYAQAWKAGDKNFIVGAAYYYYSALIGACYYFFGRFTIVAQFVNVFLGTLLVYLVYRSTFLLWGSVRTARMAAIISAFFPTLLFFSAILLREMMIIFFLLSSYFYLLLWLRKSKSYWLVISFASLVIASLLHGALIIIGAVHILLFIIYKPAEKKFKMTFKQIIIAMVILAFSVLVIEDLIIYQVPANIIDLFSLEYLQSNLISRSPGRTNYLEGFIPGSYFDLLWHSPIRIAYLLFAPFPWMLSTASDLLFLFDALLYLILFIFCLKGLRKSLKNNLIAVMSLVVFLFITVMIYSWGTVNYGTAWRHRAKIFPLLVITSSADVSSYRIKRKKGFNLLEKE